MKDERLNRRSRFLDGHYRKDMLPNTEVFIINWLVDIIMFYIFMMMLILNHTTLTIYIYITYILLESTTLVLVG